MLSATDAEYMALSEVVKELKLKVQYGYPTTETQETEQNT